VARLGPREREFVAHRSAIRPNSSRIDSPMLTRRAFLRTLAAGTAASIATGSYALAIEPRFRLIVTRYALSPPRWPDGQGTIRIAALADLHACEPWMPVSRIEEIVAATNALKPDVVVLLGDYVASIRHRLLTGVVSPQAWGRALAGLSAPLGVHAILGNHDWWTGAAAARAGLADNGIAVLENDATLLTPSRGPAFWLAGIADQLAYAFSWHHHPHQGADDLPGTLAKIPEDGRPIVLLVHEPDIFPSVPARVSLTLAGHTHGGQVDLPIIGRPIIPSRDGDRYAYGHVVEDGRHLIVSGGIGCTGLPIRFGVPPEIVLIELGGAATA
jgi:predicted MPP superfamily phosphohydrolase